ncbi:hypothetical protein GCM10009830_06110 [Glycomyces endophyticus]|uniref:Uncharacterized protein n=1 Tax=Glycomyces endophyticus TaxID=480996 RepID=A0ABN2G1E4_9ACTN
MPSGPGTSGAFASLGGRSAVVVSKSGSAGSAGAIPAPNGGDPGTRAFPFGTLARPGLVARGGLGCFGGLCWAPGLAGP